MTEYASTRSYRPDPITPEQELVEQWISTNLGDLNTWLDELLSRPEHLNYMGRMNSGDFDLVASMTLRGLYEKAYSGRLSTLDTPPEALDTNEHYTEFIVGAKSWVSARKTTPILTT
jgi:hypothetical protein